MHSESNKLSYTSETISYYGHQHVTITSRPSNLVEQQKNHGFAILETTFSTWSDKLPLNQKQVF